MKIAIAGKGGSGKTTIAGTLARALARSSDRGVLAIDADSNPNLGVTLYWGLLRQCFFVPWSHGLPTSPCWIDKRKNARGDVIIDAFLPYPWDASFHGG